MNTIEDDLPALPVPVADVSGKKEKAPRKPRPKLDYDRLLKGPKGFAHLRAHTKFTLQSQLSGKAGHEASDLAEIVTFLQEWAKLLFPKATLTEFLKKIEELCDTRLMKDYLSDLKINPDGDGSDFMTNRLLRESTAELAKLENEDFDVVAELDRVKPALPRREEETDGDESLETSEDEADDHGSDLDDFINDVSEEEVTPIQSEAEQVFESSSDLEEKAPEETKPKKVKRTILDSDEEENLSSARRNTIDADEEVDNSVQAKRTTIMSDEEVPSISNKPKTNAILFSDDE